MSSSHHRELEQLLNGLADEILDDTQEARLAELLREDGAARRQYRDFLALHADLQWDYAAAAIPAQDLALTSSAASGVSATDAAPGRRRLRWKALGAATALSIVIAVAVPLIFSRNGAHGQADRLVMGQVTRLAGRVLIIYQDQPQEIREVADLPANAVVQVAGLSGLALLRLDDGTEVSLAGDTRIECTRIKGQIRITLQQGQLGADVRPQPVTRPLLIHTPNSRIEVLGTRLIVNSDQDTSELGVRTGRVRFARLSDGRTIEVAAGQYAIASPRSSLEACDWPATGDTWQEDFESGLPDGWRYGQWVDRGLPAGSKGGVLASRRFALDGSDSNLHRITLPKRWTRGLWQIQPDTQLHFTYKMSRPGWFHIMMGVRSDDLNPSYGGNYELQSSYWAKAAEDQWRTVSVPLSAFRKNVRGVDYKDLSPASPRVGDVVTLLWFNTGDADRGLVIDRIWVDCNNQPNKETP